MDDWQTFTTYNLTPSESTIDDMPSLTYEPYTLYILHNPRITRRRSRRREIDRPGVYSSARQTGSRVTR